MIKTKKLNKCLVDFDELLLLSSDGNASSINIEVRRDKALVRIRSNGSLDTHRECPEQYARDMVDAVYQVIGVDNNHAINEIKPVGAIIERDLGSNGTMKLRLDILPAYPEGFDMVMIIL